MRPFISFFAAAAISAPLAGLAQQMPGMSGMEHHMHHGGNMGPSSGAQTDHASQMHDVGPAGATYDLRFIDGMVQHHTGALRMSEYVFDIGVPGVGSLGKRSGTISPRKSRQWGNGERRGIPMRLYIQ